MVCQTECEDAEEDLNQVFRGSFPKEVTVVRAAGAGNKAIQCLGVLKELQEVPKSWSSGWHIGSKGV